MSSEVDLSTGREIRKNSVPTMARALRRTTRIIVPHSARPESQDRIKSSQEGRSTTHWAESGQRRPSHALAALDKPAVDRRVPPFLHASFRARRVTRSLPVRQPAYLLAFLPQ
ncbi:hypothetical protein VDGL01_09510 [Verticillium dahliae]